jgi:hypothetical protein
MYGNISLKRIIYNCSQLRLSWFFSVSRGSSWNSTPALKQATSASFRVLSNSSFITILSSVLCTLVIERRKIKSGLSSISVGEGHGLFGVPG